MFYSPSIDDTTASSAVRPTFDALLLGPAEADGGAGDSAAGDSAAGDPTAATAFVWRTRAWLPPTRHQRQGLSLSVNPTEV